MLGHRRRRILEIIAHGGHEFTLGPAQACRDGIELATILGQPNVNHDIGKPALDSQTSFMTVVQAAIVDQDDGSFSSESCSTRASTSGPTIVASRYTGVAIGGNRPVFLFPAIGLPEF
jgi:hypothetical protein